MKINFTHRKASALSVGILSLIVFLATTQFASALTITPIKLELHANPGDIVKQEITLYNEQDTPQVLYVSYANFEASGETGTPALVDAKDDLGTWMQAAEKVTIASKSSQIVPVLINVPSDATPGGHFGAVLWGTQPTGKGANQVSIGYRTAVLILLSVNGDVSENGGIIEYNTKDHSRFYTSLPVGFYYRFQNNGADRVKPTGNITIKNIFGFTSALVPGNPVDGNVLPNSTRKIETVWKSHDGEADTNDKDQGNFFNKAGHEWDNFALGHYKANIALSYGVKNQIAVASVGFWVFPWHLIILVIIVAIIAFIVLRKGIHHYNSWVISRAEDMLRREQAKQSKK